MQVRSQNIDKVYITFKVIKYFLKNYKGSIMTSYLVSMLEIMHPKIVITSIDNSFKFSDIARILEKKMHFIAIQNASRFELRLNNFFLKKKIVKNNDNKRYLHSSIVSKYEFWKYVGTSFLIDEITRPFKPA